MRGDISYDRRYGYHTHHYRPGPPMGGFQPAPPGPPMRPHELPKFVVDREKTCPLMLRVFMKTGSHHALPDFTHQATGAEGLVTMYTWHDATLREITELLRDVGPDARQSRTRLSFAFVYPDRKGKNIMKQVGSVYVGKPGPDDNKTLHHLQFQTGDILSVATF